MRKKTCLPFRVAEGDAQGWHVGVVGALQDSGFRLERQLQVRLCAGINGFHLFPLEFGHLLGPGINRP